MSAKIKGAEYPLAKIFSSDFDYMIPAYQRPYAWTEEETDTLFEDLYGFYQSEPADETYFLGSIVLIKDEDKPLSEVIDGQQRLTTLTILLAVLTSRLSGEDYNDFKTYLIEPGRTSQGIPSKPRICLRPRDKDFFQTYIQGMKFGELTALNPDNQDTEAKTNIIKNTKLLLEKVDANLKTSDAVTAFGAFLVQRCYLVAVSTPTKASAFRVFSVMNSRGLSLLVTDIIKADIIGAIPDAKKALYTEEWEEMETELTRSGFNDLFSQIRMIKMKVKAKKSLQEEFYKYVLPNITGQTAIDFIEQDLAPFSEAYSIIKGCCYSAASGADNVNDILRWLNRIDNSDWLPVAMLYYTKHKDDPLVMNTFLRKLERLAAFMRTDSWDVNHRIERYAQVLKEIESDTASSMAIELSKEEIQTFLDRLNSDVYKMVSSKRNYLILRLDSFVSDCAAKYDAKILTIEHVLPQTVAAGSEWEKLWPDEAERSKWLHKIGNLLPLTKRHNSEAQNYQFDLKKDKYFKGKAGTTSYALTTQVLSYNKWTPDIVETRQKDLINAYIQGWDLK